MMDMIYAMEDELGLDDPYDLAKPFIDYVTKRYDDLSSWQEPPPSIVRKKPAVGGRLCFVITKNRSSSWAEDLSEMVSIEEHTRVYN